MTLQSDRKKSASQSGSLSTFVLLLLVSLGFALNMTAPYLLAVWMGGLMAILSHPPFAWLRRRGLGPRLASFLVTLGVVILIIGPIALTAALAVRQGVSLVQDVASGGHLSMDAIVQRVSRWKPAQSFVSDPEVLEKQLVEGLQSGAKAASALVLGWAADLPELLLQLALASLACFFLLIDGRRFVHWTLAKLPMEPDVRERLIDSFHSVSISVVWANLSASGVQAAILMVGFAALGVPGAFLAGGLAFVLAWLPTIGCVPVWAGACVYLYAQGEIARMAGMIGVGLFTGIADNLVRPIVLKGRDDLHPLASLVAIVGGIRMFGIIGVFVGPILVALLRSLLEVWPAVGKRFGLAFNAAAPAERILEKETSRA